MRLVTDGTLFASYIYPTRGDEVIQLAMNILTKKDYKRENQLSSALVTRDNARVLLMQNDETVRQQDHLTTLRSRIDQAASEFNTQRIYLLVLLVFVVLLIVACAFAIRAYVAKARINRQLHDSMSKQKAMTEEMERMDETAVEACHAVGANGVKTMFYARLPQLLPLYASLVLNHFEIAVRSASTLGLVGAGGIGATLIFAIQACRWPRVGIILLTVVVTVFLLDMLTSQIRKRLR